MVATSKIVLVVALAILIRSLLADASIYLYYNCLTITRGCYSSITRDREYEVLGSTIFALKAITVTRFVHLANLIYT